MLDFSLYIIKIASVRFKEANVVHHRDPECDEALVRLIDALCKWERETGRRSTLILVPHVSDENIVLAQDGKPFPETFLGGDPRELLETALRERGET